jgi:hypothetical protein
MLALGTACPTLLQVSLESSVQSGDDAKCYMLSGMLGWLLDMSLTNRANRKLCKHIKQAY